MAFDICSLCGDNDHTSHIVQIDSFRPQSEKIRELCLSDIQAVARLDRSGPSASDRAVHPGIAVRDCFAFASIDLSRLARVPSQSSTSIGIILDQALNRQLFHLLYGSDDTFLSY